MAQENVLNNLLPISLISDVAEINEIDITGDRFKEIIINLYATVNSMLNSINSKDSGYYYMDEMVTGQLYFPDGSIDSTTSNSVGFRPVMRKIVEFGTLPNAATKNVPHGIDVVPSFMFTRIYGVANDPVTLKWIPIPNGHYNVYLAVDSTNIIITCALDLRAYTTTYIVLEYIK